MVSACTSKTALGMLASAESQCKSQEVLASRPERPRHVQKKGCPALVVLVAYAVACRPWVLRCGTPAHALRVTKTYAAVGAGQNCSQDELCCQWCGAVAEALLPGEDQGQWQWHCFALIKSFNLLSVGAYQVVARADLQCVPLEVLGQPAQCLDCGATRGAMHSPVLALAGHSCVQKVNEQCNWDALQGKMLCLHEVQEGQAACNVAEKCVDCKCCKKALHVLVWM